MCIICNVTCGSIAEMDRKIQVASDFLNEFSAAQQAMKRAAQKMLEVSKITCKPEDGERYDAIHKEMVRQIREWNKLEQRREHGEVAVTNGDRT